MRKAVVLLSGGLDSATVLAIASNQGFQCYALSVDYGQRHRSELEAARKVAQSLGAYRHQIIKLDLTAFGGSALTDQTIEIPIAGEKTQIPITYVPARNTIMLSLALAWAETLENQDIFAGVNAVDYSGYPDCRPEYIQAFEQMANLATKAGIEGKKLTIHTPLMRLSKKDIIQTGMALGVDYSLTVSCYQADEAGRACGVCDSCRIRKAGFAAANVADPTRYRVG
ncbi:MAG: 7-cyano-7-deazaguanine synthase QueC [Nitrosomonas sp.]|jgi:7-cyano-7-deazaguanine synthase|uniref:7-cyano-7-deazaguanine synthase QueC n=1 Tax=Nitrosomonas sp. TaxID=42353 RepID=UPI001DF2E111|nr:7-cyano-7-deazaguanine synthase QueC [Nitrosomonas sp.]MBX9893602.1 7-cyano-7-deazaguanine synthase QueC [Nitrosomonas sp.]